MKTKYLIGNIKMNMDKESLIPYFENIREIAENSNNVVGVCVPSVYLDLAERYLNGSKVWYGVQNFYFEDKGTYTGEISGNMLKDFNAHMVIVGHSERRAMFNETNEDVNKKIKKALSLGLKPILCFGETRDERMSGKEKDVVKTQLFEALKDIEKERNEKNYEPLDISTKTNYYFMIRETGGKLTGAYVDGTNDNNWVNPYKDSLVGSEAYIIELAYISNSKDVKHVDENVDLYVDQVVNSIIKYLGKEKSAN